MELWHALLLGALQGVTEFLPISSSGHLHATRKVLGFEGIGITFDVLLHLATLLAVLIYFRRDLLRIASGPARWPVAWRVALASVPIFAVGYLLAAQLENLSSWVVVAGWSGSAFALYLTKGQAGRRDYERLAPWRAVLVGVAQAVAILPGVSRSGATIAAGLWLGLERTEAARFSFLIAIPAILGASAYKGLQLVESSGTAAAGAGVLSAGMVAAFLVGLASIHWLLRLVRSDRFYHFAWYNALAAATFALYLALES